MDQHTVSEGKTIAIIAYITFIGLIIAFILNNNKQNVFAKFHIEQSVRIVLAGLANSVLGWILPSSLSVIVSIIGFGLLVLIILGIINAVNGKVEPLPIIGNLGQ